MPPSRIGSHRIPTLRTVASGRVRPCRSRPPSSSSSAMRRSTGSSSALTSPSAAVFVSSDPLVGEHHRMLRTSALSQELPHHDALDDRARRRRAAPRSRARHAEPGPASTGWHLASEHVRSMTPRTCPVRGSVIGAAAHASAVNASAKCSLPRTNGRLACRDRGSDCVRADGRLRIDESRSEMDSIEPRAERTLGYPSVENVAVAAREQQLRHSSTPSRRSTS